jgi:hypothetical protein
MRKLILLVVVALTSPVALTFAIDARAQESAVTIDEVLAMMALVPVQGLLGKRPSEWRPAGFERSKDAPEIAKAIAEKAQDRVWASRLVVFGAYESGYYTRAVGDGGRSYGFLQLGNTSAWIAFDPRRAIDAWMVKAQYSLDHCGTLAAVASGNCQGGLQLVQFREDIAQKVSMMARGGGE